VATFELKNSLTKQTVEDAVTQYHSATGDAARSSSSSGRCIVHFAVDDQEVRFSTQPQSEGFMVPAVHLVGTMAQAIRRTPKA